MHPNVVLPFVSSLLSFIFAVLVFDQWLHRHRMHQLVWTVGLLFYGISAGTEFLGGAFGWNLVLYQWWYLIGAIGVAAYLGLGTVYLLSRTGFAWFAAAILASSGLIAFVAGAPPLGVGILVGAVLVALVRRSRPDWFAHAFALVLLLATAYAAYAVFSAPVDPASLPDSASVIPTGKFFPKDVRAITPVFNVTGTAALALGAAYSAYYFWRTRTMRHRLISNVLITVGAIIPAFTGSLSRFGSTSLFFLGELLGVLIIFVGFLISTEVFATFRLPGLGTVQRAKEASEQGN